MKTASNKSNYYRVRIISLSILLIVASSIPAFGFVALYNGGATSPLGYGASGFAAYVSHPMRTEELYSMIALPPTPLPSIPYVDGYVYGYNGPLQSVVNGPFVYQLNFPPSIVTVDWHDFTPQRYGAYHPTSKASSYSVPSWLYPRDHYASIYGQEYWTRFLYAYSGVYNSSFLGHFIRSGSYEDVGWSWGDDAMWVVRTASIGMLHGGFSYTVGKHYPYYDLNTTFRTNWGGQEDLHTYVENSLRKLDATNLWGTVTSPFPLSQTDVKRMMGDRNVEDFDLLAEYGRAMSEQSILELEMPHVSMIFTTNLEGTGPNLSSAPIVVNIAPQFQGLPAPGKFHTANPNGGTGRSYNYNFNGAYTNQYRYHYESFSNGIPQFATGEAPIDNVTVENYDSTDSQNAGGQMRRIKWYGSFSAYGPTGPDRTALAEAAYGENISGWVLTPQIQISDSWLVTFKVKEFTGNVAEPDIGFMHAELELVPDSAVAVAAIQP